MITFKVYKPQLEVSSLNQRLWCPLCKAGEERRKSSPIYKDLALTNSISSSSGRALEIVFLCGAASVYSYGDKALYLDDNCYDTVRPRMDIPCPLCLCRDINKAYVINDNSITEWMCGCQVRDRGNDDVPQLCDVLPNTCKGQPFWKNWLNL